VTVSCVIASFSNGLIELGRTRVDAVALAGRGRAIVEDVPEVGTAPAAGHLDPSHSVAPVLVELDRLDGRRLPEAWPPGAGLELGAGAEKRGAAPGTAVG